MRHYIKSDKKVVEYVNMDFKGASPFVWLISFFLLLFIYTKLVGPIPFSINSVTTAKSATFDVTGEGKAVSRPDMAAVTAGISTQANTVKSAQDQINNVMNRVSEAVKQAGVDAKDIQTTNYSIYPTYNYSDGAQKITGYSARTTILIKVRNLDKVNDVIDIATSSGANQISGITFDLSDKVKLQDEARQKAVEEAKKKAERAAQIAGFKLGRIINYAENFQGMPRPLPAMMEGVKAVGSTATQVEPGSSEVTITVTLSYEIY